MHEVRMTESEARVRLPKAARDIIGRDRDIATIAGQLESGKAVVVVGPGGIGKTTVANAIAQRAREAGRETWVCDLSRAATHEDALSVIARVTDVPAFAGTDTAARQQRLVEGIVLRGTGLLVLDNVEQLPEAFWDLVVATARCPGLRVIATSRTMPPEGVGIPFELDALEEEDAITLFRLRARQAGADASEAAQGEGATRELVRKLEGMPLAIELAAARSRVLPANVLARRLDSGFDVLSISRGDRHGAIRATVRSSWDLLSDRERDVLSQCAVFRGGFTEEAARAVLRIREGGDPAPSLSVLASWFLLKKKEHPERSPRYEIAQPVLDFVAERFGARIDRSEVEARHAAYTIEFARRALGAMRGPDEKRWMDRLGEEHDNLRAIIDRMLRVRPHLAAEAALALDEALRLHAAIGPHASMLERVLDEVDIDHHPTTWGRLKLALGRGCAMGSRLEDAIGNAEQALLVVDDPRDVAEAFALKGNALRFQGATDLAEKAFLEGIERVEGTGNDDVLAILIGRLAFTAHGKGEIDRARQLYARSLALHEVTGRKRFAAIEQANFGLLLHELNENDAALRAIEDAVRAHLDIGNRRYAAMAMTYLAGIHLERGEPTEASRWLARSVPVHRASGDARFESLALSADGICCALLDRPIEGLEKLTRAAALADESNDPPIAVFANTSLALLHNAMGALERARTRLATARDRAAHVAPSIVGMLELLGAAVGIPLATIRVPVTIETAALTVEVRHGHRLVRRAVAMLASMRSLPRVLEVDASYSWITPPHSERVDLTSRAQLRVLMRHLVAMHANGGHESLGVDTAMELFWAAERIDISVAKNRLRVAIATLRTSGLKGVIVTDGDRYRLASDVRVVVANSN